MTSLSVSKLEPPAGSDEENDDDTKDIQGSGKSRRELPSGAVATLKAWLLSPEHFTHPYPTPQDQVMLMQKTGIDKKQLKNWFTNARRRIWKPMLKKQLEQGKLAATGAGGGGVAGPGIVPGLMVPTVPANGPPRSAPGQAPEMSGTPEASHSVQNMHTHFQPEVHPQQAYDSTYSNRGYTQHTAQLPSHHGAPVSAPAVPQHYGNPHYFSPQQYASSVVPCGAPMSGQAAIASSNSIGSLPPMGISPIPGSQVVPGTHMNKTDSHAVLMELFARDQDLVRQATESAKFQAAAKVSTTDQHRQQITAQNPTKTNSHGNRLGSVPTLTSWPHFSSISSLNNLGTMTGVKSITSLSGADLASQGNLNKMGNLAQVKSIESMGRNDSYAFLEVFFGDRSSSSLNLSEKEPRGLKREREEDNDVGLSLDGDESPSATTMKSSVLQLSPNDTQVVRAQLGSEREKVGINESGTLKRAYDDALAARGLISVSRSCEKLTDLPLPPKMQRTLSQEYLRQQLGQTQPQQVSHFFSSLISDTSGLPRVPVPAIQLPNASKIGNNQLQYQTSSHHFGESDPAPLSSAASPTNASVEVPSATKCALCHYTNVDTQLRPCGHMFHERCLKPSLQATIDQPKCPIDHTPMQSALLAVPTEDVRIF